MIANQFIIRAVDRSSGRFLFSDNLWEVASRQGFWAPEKGPLDFLLTYAPKRAHSPYATRRVWRVFNLVAPSLILPGDTDPYASNYPFSVKVEKRMDVADVMTVLRDHYEGSVYDLTQGLAAGPYGDPNRFDAAPTAENGLTFTELIQGSYERSISLFRTSYSFVAPSRASVDDSLSLLWFAQHAPSGSSYGMCTSFAMLYLRYMHFLFSATLCGFTRDTTTLFKVSSLIYSVAHQQSKR